MAGTPFRNDGHKQALQPDDGDLRWTIVTCRHEEDDRDSGRPRAGTPVSGRSAGRAWGGTNAAPMARTPLAAVPPRRTRLTGAAVHPCTGPSIVANSNENRPNTDSWRRGVEPGAFGIPGRRHAESQQLSPPRTGSEGADQLTSAVSCELGPPPSRPGRRLIHRGAARAVENCTRGRGYRGGRGRRPPAARRDRRGP